MIRPLILGGMVFGPTFLDLFERFCVASMRSPANLEALRDNGAKVVIYTNRQDAPRGRDRGMGDSQEHPPYATLLGRVHGGTEARSGGMNATTANMLVKHPDLGLPEMVSVTASGLGKTIRWAVAIPREMTADDLGLIEAPRMRIRWSHHSDAPYSFWLGADA